MFQGKRIIPYRILMFVCILSYLAYLIELLHSPRSLLLRSMETQNERNRTRVKSGNLSLSTPHHPSHAHI